MYETRRQVILAAANLISEDDVENNEYDRALVELVGSMLGLDLGDDQVRDTIRAMLRAVQ